MNYEYFFYFKINNERIIHEVFIHLIHFFKKD